MSAVGIARGLLGPVLSPKVAAPVAGGGLLMASDDAESKVSGTIKNINKLVAELNALAKKGVGNRHRPRAAESVMHNDEYTNYNEMNTFATQIDGTDAGPYWKEQVGVMADAVEEHPDLSDAAREIVGAWRVDHLGRQPGDLAKKRQAAKNKIHKKQPQAPKNNAMALALAGAAGAGAASADESPTMDWREWPAPQDQPIPTSPEERGFRPWSDYEQQPSYWDRVTDPATYADALRPYVQGAGWLANTRVGQYVGDQLGDAVEAAQMPGQAIHGLGRGVYGLATGESPGQAFSAGMDVAQNDLAENGALMKQWAADRGWHEDDAAAAGFATEFLADPLTYAGMGLLGRIGRAF